MKKIILISLLIFSFHTMASVPLLTNLSSDDVNKISKEFAANYAHTINAPASSYGKLFGFEIGALGGMTTSTTIKDITKKYDSTSNIAFIPTGGLILGVSGPLGVGGEANFIPKITYVGLSIQNTSAAFKWTFTDLIPTAPINMAVRVHGSSSTFSYHNTISNVNTGMEWKNTNTGYNFEISKKLLFIEPYIGFGSISSKTKIGVTAASAVSVFSFTSATSYTAENSGSHLYAGTNLNLFIFKIGAEYAKIMGVTKIVTKLSLYF